MSRVSGRRRRRASAEADDQTQPARPDSDFALDWIALRAGASERRQVVVLALGFSDPPPDPTDPAAEDPEALTERLAARAVLVAEIVARLGGTVIATGIDHAAACWGWPACSGDDARLAVTAGLEIVARLDGGVRCGVDGGIAVTGPVDALGGLRVVGEVVRNANQLKSFAPLEGLVVGAALHPLLDTAFRTEMLTGDTATSPWLVRRWTGPASCHQTTAGRLQLAPAMHDGWIGRDSEFSHLLERWRRAGRGAASFVLVNGEAGIGKTTLVAMLHEHVANSAACVIAVPCREGRVALDPMLRLAETFLALHPAGTERAPAVTTSGAARSGSAEELCDRLATLIERVSTVRPLAIVVDNLHSADAATLSCLALLTVRLQITSPVLLLAASRNSLPPQLSATGRWQIDRLGRLPQASIERILALSPVSQALPEPARQKIAELSEGIPFYAIEMARMQSTIPASAPDHRILLRPSRITNLIASRLDAVGNLKPLAQVAAVLGRVVDSRVLAAMLEIEHVTLVARLDILADRGILSRMEGETGERYRFAHALLWSVAYGSMLKSSRSRLHARAAADLVGRFPETAAATPADVARHLVKAGTPGMAFTWWHKAAIAAAANGAAASAVAHVGEALAARSAAPNQCSPLEEAELMRLLGVQLGTLGGSASPEIQGVYTRALELLSQLPERPVELDFDIRWGITNIHMVRGEFGSTLASSSLLIEEARETGRDDQLVVALRLNGTARLLTGRIREAIELLETLATVYRPALSRPNDIRYLSDQGLVGIAHLAWARAIHGDAEASVAAQRRALALAGRLAHPHTSSAVLGTLAGAAQIRADVIGATTFARACQELSAEHGYRYWAARAGLVQGWAAAQRDPARGLDMIHSASQRYRGTGSGRALSYVDYLEAEIALAAQQPRLALAALERAQAAGHLQSDRLYAAEFLRLRALAMVACDPAARPVGEQLLIEAETLARSQGAEAFAARAAGARVGLVGRPRAKQVRAPG